MRLTEASFGAGRPVDGYGPGYFRLGELRHAGPLALFPEGLVAWAGLPDTAPLLARADTVDVLLLGLGAEIAALDEAVRAPLEAAEIGYEIMSTAAACRSYNVLLAEGRRVALAAMPVF